MERFFHFRDEKETMTEIVAILPETAIPTFDSVKHEASVQLFGAPVTAAEIVGCDEKLRPPTGPR